MAPTNDNNNNNKKTTKQQIIFENNNTSIHVKIQINSSHLFFLRKIINGISFVALYNFSPKQY